MSKPPGMIQHHVHEPYRNAFTAWASADLSSPPLVGLLPNIGFTPWKSTQRTHATAPLAALFAKVLDDTRATIRHLLTGRNALS